MSHVVAQAFATPQKWRILSGFCLKTARNRGVFLAALPFKSNKRSHSGDNEAEDPPVPIPNTEVKLCVAESTIRDTVWEGEDMHFIEWCSTPFVYVRTERAQQERRKRRQNRRYSCGGCEGSCRISKKRNHNQLLWLRLFFATFYPPTEGEKHVLKIVQWTILVFRGEPTTKI